ncbi:hypothetical protein BDR26DRAFT_850942 [Obelidium mucronatum]|nr:hypothetical protein BDR26DRAFT_850942 [Obelidium mucronatum]
MTISPSPAPEDMDVDDAAAAILTFSSSIQLQPQHGELSSAETLPIGAATTTTATATAAQENSVRKERTPRPLPCSSCRLQRKRCGTEKPSCQRCLETGTECTYAVTSKRYVRRMPPPAAASHSGAGGGGDGGGSRSYGHPAGELSDLQSPQISDYSVTSSTLDDRASSSGFGETPLSAVSGSSSSDSQGPLSDIGVLAQKYQAEIAALTRRPLPCDCCRQQKKKCDRARPICNNCSSRNLTCEYILPPQKAALAKWRARLVLENQLAAAAERSAGCSSSRETAVRHFTDDQSSAPNSYLEVSNLNFKSSTSPQLQPSVFQNAQPQILITHQQREYPQSSSYQERPQMAEQSHYHRSGEHSQPFQSYRQNYHDNFQLPHTIATQPLQRFEVQFPAPSMSVEIAEQSHPSPPPPQAAVTKVMSVQSLLLD